MRYDHNMEPNFQKLIESVSAAKPLTEKVRDAFLKFALVAIREKQAPRP